jgi:dihydropyrimidinase
MQGRLVVRGGLVVNADWSGPATVVLRHGRVETITSPQAPLPTEVDRVIDAAGQLVLPGGVDPHCHIQTTIGAFTTRDDYASASVGALFGGTTTVIDFAIPSPGQSPWEAVLERRTMARQSRCDTALHGCVVDWDDTVPAQLRKMANDGVRTIKLFTTYRGEVMAEPDTVLRVMEVLSEIGGLAYVHAEADHLVQDAQAKQAIREAADACHHHLTRPEISESAAVAQVLTTAEALGAPVYFVHQTTGEAVQLVRQARSRGVRAYTETCPHYLFLDSSAYAGPHPERYVCCPPLRPVDQTSALRRLVHAAEIDTIGSDHCCFNTEQKLERADDVRAMPNGMPGVETRLPVVFSRLVLDEGFPLERFVAVCAANPAKLNGLYPRKGVLAPGADADVVIFDPKRQRQITDASVLHMDTDYSPYEGQTLTGWPTTVISSGRVVIDEDVFSDPGPVGRALQADSLTSTLLV